MKTNRTKLFREFLKRHVQYSAAETTGKYGDEWLKAMDDFLPKLCCEMRFDLDHGKLTSKQREAGADVFSILKLLDKAIFGYRRFVERFAELMAQGGQR